MWNIYNVISLHIYFVRACVCVCVCQYKNLLNIFAQYLWVYCWQIAFRHEFTVFAKQMRNASGWVWANWVGVRCTTGRMKLWLTHAFLLNVKQNEKRNKIAEIVTMGNGCPIITRHQPTICNLKNISIFVFSPVQWHGYERWMKKS